MNRKARRKTIEDLLSIGVDDYVIKRDLDISYQSLYAYRNRGAAPTTSKCEAIKIFMEKWRAKQRLEQNGGKSFNPAISKKIGEAAGRAIDFDPEIRPIDGKKPVETTELDHIFTIVASFHALSKHSRGIIIEKLKTL